MMFKKERGVVLISCLVFLLLILALVRISLSASSLEQEKTKIDVDTMAARENALIGLKAAEQAIQGKNKNGDFCGTTAVLSGCENSLAANPNNVISGATSGVSLIVPEENENAWMAQSLMNYAESPSTINKGVQDLNSIKTCGEQPIWKCVKWNKEAFVGERDSEKQFIEPIEYGKATDLGNFPVPNTPTPEYIIEVIPGESLDIPNKTLVRVTVVGYGRKLPDEKPANAMIQATYMLPEASFSLIPTGKK